MIGRIRKALTPLVTGGLTWAGIVVASSSAEITAPEWLLLGGVVATAVGVYAVPNAPHP